LEQHAVKSHEFDVWRVAPHTSGDLCEDVIRRLSFDEPSVAFLDGLVRQNGF
jgi:hypothetical protein